MHRRNAMALFAMLVGAVLAGPALLVVFNAFQESGNARFDRLGL